MFRGLKEAYFDVFCHISRLEILRTETLQVLYLIVNLLFRRDLIDWAFQFQLFQFLVLMFQYPLLIYITIYILINYIYYIRGYCILFFKTEIIEIEITEMSSLSY